MWYIKLYGELHVADRTCMKKPILCKYWNCGLYDIQTHSLSNRYHWASKLFLYSSLHLESIFFLDKFSHFTCYYPCIGTVLCSETQEPRISFQCSLNVDVYQYHPTLLLRGNVHRSIAIIVDLAVSIVLFSYCLNYRATMFCR